MKILQLIQRPQLRGAEIFACQLSSELKRFGHESDVAWLFDGWNRLSHLFPELKFTSLGASLPFRAFDPGAYGRLNAMIRQGNYDLVQANAGDTLKYAALSKRLFGWKAPLVFRNANVMSRFIRGPLHRKLNAWLIVQCDYVIAVSETCRRDVGALCPSRQSRSMTIPIGTRRFDDVAAADKPTHDPLFVSIASFVPEKNHKFLVEVFHEFVRRRGVGQLWLVGDGPLRQATEAEVIRRGIGDRVNFRGAVAEPIPILKAADCLLMPSLIEGLPGVILEALSCGVPVIASGAGGIQEIIDDGRTGFCIHDFDVDQYVRRMEEILQPEVRAALADNGRKLIDGEYLLPAIAERFRVAYENILGDAN